MAFKRILAAAVVLLMAQAAVAQQCDSETSAARDAQCSDDVFDPKTCRSALTDGSTAYKAFAAAWMARVAYDKDDGVTWETAARSELARWGFSDIRFGSGGGVEFFVADAPGAVWVVFRGSDTGIDWKTNLRTEFVSVRGLGQVHRGFWDAWVAAQPGVDGFISDFRQGSKGVIYAGHSLGGAIATLAAATRQYNTRGSVAHLFTFGSPRVGDASWAQSYAELGLGQLTNRYVTDRDPVPMVPPGGSVGYRHVGSEVRLFSGSANDCRAGAAPASCPSGSVPSIDGGLGDWLAGKVCGGNAYAQGLADFLASFTDLTFSATDLLNAEPTICCADGAVHDLSFYTQWIRGGCLGACDRLVDCSCQQDEPTQASTPTPAGDGQQPSDQQDSTPEELEPVQPEPEPSPEPPRDPYTAVYHIVVQTACEAYAGTDADLELQLTDAQGRWYRTGYLDNPGNDLEQCTQNVFDLGTSQWVDLSSTSMQVYFRSTSLIWGEWRPAWIQVIQNPGTSQVASRSFCIDGFLTTAGWYDFSLC